MMNTFTLGVAQSLIVTEDKKMHSFLWQEPNRNLHGLRVVEAIDPWYASFFKTFWFPKWRSLKPFLRSRLWVQTWPRLEEPGTQHIPSTSFTILPSVIIIQSGGPQHFRWKKLIYESITDFSAHLRTLDKSWLLRTIKWQGRISKSAPAGWVPKTYNIEFSIFVGSLGLVDLPIIISTSTSNIQFM